MARKLYSKMRSQLWKILEIDRQLREQKRTGRPCTKETLLKGLRYDINERTLRRTIEVMRDELGAPIVYDRLLQTYKLQHDDWHMPNISLDEAELQVLATAIQAVRPVLPTLMSERLDMLLAKLLDALPLSRCNAVRRAQGQIEFVPAPILSKGMEWLEPLCLAILDRYSVDMVYHVPGRDENTRRRFDPYYLRNVQGIWYAVGYDHFTKHWPIFKLARIRELKVSEDLYTVKPFSAATYFKNSLGIMVGGKPQHVRVRLTGYAASTAEEYVWPDGFTCQRNGPNEVVLSGQVLHLAELLQWTASFQGDAEILP
ncbi:MAG: helix-turn-helix transcriptional regulator [Phycisphaerae bacterium]